MMRKRQHKYRVKPQITEDGRFDSKKELRRWEELKLLEDAGQISHLTRIRKECTFSLRSSSGEKVCDYIVDYIYRENGKAIAEDCKGMKTDVYRIKRKWFIADYGHLYEHRES